MMFIQKVEKFLSFRDKAKTKLLELIATRRLLAFLVTHEEKWENNHDLKLSIVTQCVNWQQDMLSYLNKQTTDDRHERIVLTHASVLASNIIKKHLFTIDTCKDIPSFKVIVKSMCEDTKF